MDSKKDKVAISVEGGNDNTISNNKFVGYDQGVRLTDTERNTVDNNVSILPKKKKKKWYMNPWIVGILTGLLVLTIGAIIKTILNFF